MNKLTNGWKVLLGAFLIYSIEASLPTTSSPHVAQSSNRTLITEKSIGPVRLGMTVAQVRKVLRGYKLSRTSDGEGLALIAVERRGKTLMTFYAGETDPNRRINERAVVEFVDALDASYRTSARVHPRMSLQAVEQKYGKLKEIVLSEIESREYATFTNQPDGIQMRVMNDQGTTAGVYPEGQNRTTRYAPSTYVLSISISGMQDAPLTSSPTPRFEDYPAQKFTGRLATPIIANQRARLYRTMIREDALKGPNFAGHYTIARWGCGSTCVGFAVIDARTGKIHFHPKVPQVMQVPYQAEDVLQFRPDSRLLIISGEILPIDPNSSGRSEYAGKFYYEWKNSQFRLVGTAAIRREAGAPPLPF